MNLSKELRKGKTMVAWMVLSIAVICLVSVLRRDSFTVANDSSKSIVEASITVCRHNFVVHNLNPGQSKSFNFPAAGDSGYVISALFSDGRRLTKADGYLTIGYLYNDTITITNQDIQVKQQR